MNIERGVYLRLIRWEELVENGGIGKILNAHLVSVFPRRTSRILNDFARGLCAFLLRPDQGWKVPQNIDVLIGFRRIQAVGLTLSLVQNKAMLGLNLWFDDEWWKCLAGGAWFESKLENLKFRLRQASAN